LLFISVFIALTLLIGQQEEHPTCKQSCFGNPKCSSQASVDPA